MDVNKTKFGDGVVRYGECERETSELLQFMFGNGSVKTSKLYLN